MTELMPIILLSLKVAFLATFIGTFFGVILGFVFARTNFVGKNLIDTIFTLPMVLPPTVLGYYLLTLLNKQSGFGLWLYSTFGIDLIFTWQAAVIAASIVTFPLILKPARAAFEEVNQTFEKASFTLGLSRTETFFRITLPLAWRGILSGILLAFARALGEFGATLMVAGSTEKTRTLSIAIYQAYNNFDEDLTLKLVLITSLICISVLMLATFLKPKNR